MDKASAKLAAKRGLAASLWVATSSVIIAFSHVTLHLKQVALFSLPEAAALFLIPLICSFMMPFFSGLEELSSCIYAGILTGILSMIIVGVAFYSPAFYGVMEFTDDYAAYVIKQLMISAIAILPTTIVGSAVGGAFTTDASPAG